MLNIHEDVQAKPSSWVIVAWLPILDEEKSLRPGQGYEGDAARKPGWWRLTTGVTMRLDGK